MENNKAFYESEEFEKGAKDTIDKIKELAEGADSSVSEVTEILMRLIAATNPSAKALVLANSVSMKIRRISYNITFEDNISNDAAKEICSLLTQFDMLLSDLINKHNLVEEDEEVINERRKTFEEELNNDE